MYVSATASSPVYRSTTSGTSTASTAAEKAQETAADPSGQNTTNVADPLLADETQAALLALQEVPEAPEDDTTSITINGLDIVTSGHSIDTREGVSLLRTVSNPDLTAALMGMASDVETAKKAGTALPDAGPYALMLETSGGLTEVSAEALQALPGGADSAYMNIDFMRTKGTWDGGDPIKKSNAPEDMAADQRTRIESLMNVVDAERQLKAQYGDDIKLVYSHVDQSYIMLTPDDARYDEMQSAESSVQDVVSEVHRGYVDKDAVGDILKRYGYQV